MYNLVHNIIVYHVIVTVHCIALYYSTAACIAITCVIYILRQHIHIIYNYLANIVHTYTYTYIYIYIYMYVIYSYTCICICMCVYIYIYIYI